MKTKILALLAALGVVAMSACGPDPQISWPNPVPPNTDLIVRTILFTWSGLLPDPGAPSGNGTPWKQRTIDCTVIAHRPVPGQREVPYDPVDPFALLFPHEWYLACGVPNANRPPASAMRTLKITQEPNDPSQTPVMTCVDFSGPIPGDLIAPFNCEYVGNGRVNAYNPTVWGRGYVQVTGSASPYGQ